MILVKGSRSTVGKFYGFERVVFDLRIFDHSLDDWGDEDDIGDVMLADGCQEIFQFETW